MAVYKAYLIKSTLRFKNASRAAPFNIPFCKGEFFDRGVLIILIILIILNNLIVLTILIIQII